jgi:O-antigen/teichoic acid export membrane protein
MIICRQPGFIKYMKKQAFALIFANGINFLVNFIMAPFLARQLSYTDNGTYGHINLINGFVAILFGLGLSSVINLLLAENKGNEKEMISTSFWIHFFSALVCILLLFIFSDWISILFNNPDLGIYLRQYLPSTFLMILTNLVIYYYIYYNKAQQLSLLTVSLNLLKIAAVYYAVNTLHSFYFVVLFLNIVNLVQLAAHVYFLRKQVFPVLKPNYPQIQYVLKLSFPYMGMAIIGYSILYINGVIVSNQLGVKEFAIYRNGAIEIPFIATLYTSITAVALPQIVELTRSKNIQGLLHLKRKISNSVAAMIYPAAFFCILNGKVFIELYLGDKYIQSGIIFCIYNIAILIRINSYTDILTILKKPNKVLLPNIISLVMGIIISFVLISFIGVKGAAISFVLSIFVLCILWLKNTCKLLDINLNEYFDFKVIGKIVAISVIAAILSMLFMKVELVSFVTIGIIYVCVVYLLLLKFKLIDLSLLPVGVQSVIRKFQI